MNLPRIEQSVRETVYRRAEWQCWYCGVEVVVEGNDAVIGASIDHVLPLDRGGKHEIENFVTCCRRCNSAKRNRTTEEYRISCNKNLRKANLLEIALEVCETPFDPALIEHIEWLRNQAAIVFHGEKEPPTHWQTYQTKRY